MLSYNHNIIKIILINGEEITNIAGFESCRGVGFVTIATTEKQKYVIPYSSVLKIEVTN